MARKGTSCISSLGYRLPRGARDVCFTLLPGAQQTPCKAPPPALLHRLLIVRGTRKTVPKPPVLTQRNAPLVFHEYFVEKTGKIITLYQNALLQRSYLAHKSDANFRHLFPLEENRVFPYAACQEAWETVNLLKTVSLEKCEKQARSLNREIRETEAYHNLFFRNSPPGNLVEDETKKVCSKPRPGKLTSRCSQRFGLLHTAQETEEKKDHKLPATIPSIPEITNEKAFVWNCSAEERKDTAGSDGIFYTWCAKGASIEDILLHHHSLVSRRCGTEHADRIGYNEEAMGVSYKASYPRRALTHNSISASNEETMTDYADWEKSKPSFSQGTVRKNFLFGGTSERYHCIVTQKTESDSANEEVKRGSYNDCPLQTNLGKGQAESITVDIPFPYRELTGTEYSRDPPLGVGLCFFQDLLGRLSGFCTSSQGHTTSHNSYLHLSGNADLWDIAKSEKEKGSSFLKLPESAARLPSNTCERKCLQKKATKGQAKESNRHNRTYAGAFRCSDRKRKIMNGTEYIRRKTGHRGRIKRNSQAPAYKRK